MSNEKLIGRAEVSARTGFSQTTLWRLEKSGNFPKRIKIGPKAVRWSETEVTGWIESVMSSRVASEAGKSPRCKKVLKNVRSQISFISIPQDIIDTARGYAVDAYTAMSKADGYAKLLDGMYGGKIAKWDGQEWYIRDIYYHAGQYQVHMYRINKRKPWEYTDTDTYRPLADVMVSERRLSDRSKAVKESN